MSERPTPEADAAAKNWHGVLVVEYDVARKLERVRDEARSHRDLAVVLYDELYTELCGVSAERYEVMERQRRTERERNQAMEALREIKAADWKTSGELRGMAKRALEAAK